jgi:hypothetical protein
VFPWSYVEFDEFTYIFAGGLAVFGMPNSSRTLIKSADIIVKAKSTLSDVFALVSINGILRRSAFASPSSVVTSWSKSDLLPMSSLTQC